MHTVRSTTNDLPRNYWRWLGIWNPQAQLAFDWACKQFPGEIQRRGVARAYYDSLWVLGETLRVLPNGPRNINILDVGCGAGVHSIALRHLGANVTALDRFNEYEDDYDNQMGSVHDIVARFQANGITVQRQDFVSGGLPQESEKYDLILFLAVIEHLHESPKAVLESMYRLLKPGGHVVITTPNHAWLRTRLRLLVGRSAHHPLEEWWQTPFYGHVREYTLPELTTMLRWSNFDVRTAKISSWWHASSRIRSSIAGGTEHWTTRLTLNSPERLVVAASLLVSALIPSLRYNLLAIGRKP